MFWVTLTLSSSNAFNLEMTEILLHSNGLLNSLPNDKILDLAKLKYFADDKINAT